jgi:hypothetical protein
MPRPKKGEPNRSEFIRKHAELPVAEIVEKAKAEGLSITPALIYSVKGRATAKKATPKATKKAPAKKGSKKATSKPKAAPPKQPAAAPTKSAPPAKPEGKLTASGFIRSLPASVPAKDVIAQAIKQGIKPFSANLVYAVRAGSKKTAPKPVASTKAPKVASKATAATKAATSPETILARLVLAHGFGKVEEMLAAAGRRVESLLAGR